MNSSFIGFQVMLEIVALVFSLFFFFTCLLVPFEDICAKITSQYFCNAQIEVLCRKLYFALLWL